MNLWRKTRTEVAGAWRSLRYDMGRRETAPDGDEQDEVTSTGMSTFGMPLDELRTGYAEFGRPPRRLVAVSLFAVLTIAGAAGSYFAVVNGLGSLLREKPAAPQAYPLAVAEPPAETDATTKMGHGTPRAKATAVPETAAAAASPAGVPPAAPVPPEQRRTAPERAVRPVPTPCNCLMPPVPTPTAPSTSPGASAGGSPSPSATPSDPGEGDPSVSPDPSGSHDGQHAKQRKRHPRGY